MSNNNKGLKREVVLPPSGSGAQTIVGNNGLSDKAQLKQRLVEIKTEQRTLTSEAKGIQKQLTKMSAPKKKSVNKTVSKKKTTASVKKDKK